MVTRTLGSGLAAGAIAVVVLAVASALMLIDSPWTARAKRLDGQRAFHLQSISSAINCYWTLEKRQGLPADLEALKTRMDAETATRGLPAYCLPGDLADPETGTPYGYAPLGGDTYELCATFSRPSEGVDTYDAPRGAYSQRWAHPEGRHCFRLEAATVDLPGVASAG